MVSYRIRICHCRTYLMVAYHCLITDTGVKGRGRVGTAEGLETDTVQNSTLTVFGSSLTDRSQPAITDYSQTKVNLLPRELIPSLESISTK